MAFWAHKSLSGKSAGEGGTETEKGSKEGLRNRIGDKVIKTLNYWRKKHFTEGMLSVNQASAQPCTVILVRVSLQSTCIYLTEICSWCIYKTEKQVQKCWMIQAHFKEWNPIYIFFNVKQAIHTQANICIIICI